MSELAFGVRSRALIPLELPAHFELQPARVFAVEEAIHVHHGGHRRHKSQGGGKCARSYAELVRRIGRRGRARARAPGMHFRRS